MISIRGGGSAAATPATLIRAHNQLRIFSLNSHHAVLDDELVVQEPACRARIDHMLLPEYARCELVGAFAGAHADRGLDHDRPAVELGGDEMHREAVELHAP